MKYIFFIRAKVYLSKMAANINAVHHLASANNGVATHGSGLRSHVYSVGQSEPIVVCACALPCPFHC